MVNYVKLKELIFHETHFMQFQSMTSDGITCKKFLSLPYLSPDAHAKEAVTNYELVEAFGEVSYLKLRLETGRTHQIRVHMSYLGHALLGDTVYASTKTRFEKAHPTLFDGQMLHAARLILTHPKTGERMEFSSPLPENFSRALELLYNEAN